MGGNPTLEEFGKNLTTFRFAVLRHELPAHSERESHWDLLLEPPIGSASGLLTFESSMPPDKWVNHKVCVKRLSDHRLLYLDYEGPISGDRGYVTRVLSGAIQWKVQQEDLMVLSVRQTWPCVVDRQLRIARLPSNEENCWEMHWQSAD